MEEEHDGNENDSPRSVRKSKLNSSYTTEEH